MDFCKSCEELHAVSRIPLTIVHQEGEVRLVLPAGHEELIPHRALTWVLADFVLQKRDALHTQSSHSSDSQGKLPVPISGAASKLYLWQRTE